MALKDIGARSYFANTQRRFFGFKSKNLSGITGATAPMFASTDVFWQQHSDVKGYDAVFFRRRSPGSRYGSLFRSNGVCSEKLIEMSICSDIIAGERAEL
jgi:hypothetical protein